jgi:hypothetical protein
MWGPINKIVGCVEFSENKYYIYAYFEKKNK